MGKNSGNNGNGVCRYVPACLHVPGYPTLSTNIMTRIWNAVPGLQHASTLLRNGQEISPDDFSLFMRYKQGFSPGYIWPKVSVVNEMLVVHKDFFQLV